MKKQPFSKIAGTGHYLPETILTNQDLEKIMDTTDEWIMQRVGIRQRHIVGQSGEATSDLASKAALKAIEDAGIKASDIDLIIIGTVTPDMKFPSTAIFVQQKIGAVNAAAFDIQAACTGFLYGMTIADSMIRTGKFKNVLVVGVEFLTSLINWNDRGTAVLFGDGAGAVIMQPADGDSGLLGSYIKSSGDLAELLWSVGGGTYAFSSKENIPDRNAYIRMEGNQVFRHAVRAMIDSAEKAMADAGITEDDIDLLIPHQANMRIIEAIATRVKLPAEKVYVNLPYTGNTSAASIPIAMDQARKKGVLKAGDTVMMAAFGAGFTWGGVVVKF